MGSTDKLSSPYSVIHNFGVGKSILLCFTAFIVKRTIDAGDPVHYIIPNMLLFTPFVDTQAAIWRYLQPMNRAPKDWTPKEIPIIEAKDFSVEKMKEVSDDYRRPIMVRGLLKDSKAVKEWANGKSLVSKLGDHNLPYIVKSDFGAHQGSGNREVDSFRNISMDILADSSSKKYLFFPVKSRFQYNGSGIEGYQNLVKDTNEIVHDDLEVERLIYKGFGTSADKLWRGSQIIMGNGAKNLSQTTGTLWHCAIGSNWFIQVVGRKRWYFMDQKYSSLMSPLKGGLVNIQVGSKATQEDALDKAPYDYVDLHAGDMLYNPDYTWHAIQNYEGLSIGCPVRFRSLRVAFRNNLQYASIGLINLVTSRLFGFSIGGYAEMHHLK